MKSHTVNDAFRKQRGVRKPSRGQLEAKAEWADLASLHMFFRRCERSLRVAFFLLELHFVANDVMMTAYTTYANDGGGGDS